MAMPDRGAFFCCGGGPACVFLFAAEAGALFFLLPRSGTLFFAAEARAYSLTHLPSDESAEAGHFFLPRRLGAFFFAAEAGRVFFC